MAAVCVQQVALRVRAHQALVRVLAVDVDQAVAQLAQLRDGGGRAVDIRAAASLGVDHAAQGEFFVSVEFALGQPGTQRRGGIEDGGDVGARGALAQHAGVAALAQRQGQGVDEDGLARAGLAGKHGEARAEMDLGLFDDDEVADMQGAQHGGANYSTLSVACGIGFQCSLRRRVEKKL